MKTMFNPVGTIVVLSYYSIRFLNLYHAALPFSLTKISTLHSLIYNLNSSSKDWRCCSISFFREFKFFVAFFRTWSSRGNDACLQMRSQMFIIGWWESTWIFKSSHTIRLKPYQASFQYWMVAFQQGDSGSIFILMLFYLYSFWTNINDWNKI